MEKRRNRRTEKLNTKKHEAVAAVAIELGSAKVDVQNPVAETSSNTINFSKFTLKSKIRRDK